MLSIVFDTETTGKANYQSSVKAPHQPHIVELAFEMYCSEREEVVSKYSSIVNPGIEVPESVTKIHGLDTTITQKYGINEKIATAIFHQHMMLADQIVCHNVTFDLFIMQIAYWRYNRSVIELLSKPTFCTMLESIEIVGIEKPQWQQKKYGEKYKWPSLEETYAKLCNLEGFKYSHRAWADVAATTEILAELNYMRK